MNDSYELICGLLCYSEKAAHGLSNLMRAIVQDFNSYEVRKSAPKTFSVANHIRLGIAPDEEVVVMALPGTMVRGDYIVKSKDDFIEYFINGCVDYAVGNDMFTSVKSAMKQQAVKYAVHWLHWFRDRSGIDLQADCWKKFIGVPLNPLQIAAKEHYLNTAGRLKEEKSLVLSKIYEEENTEIAKVREKFLKIKQNTEDKFVADLEAAFDEYKELTGKTLVPISSY